MCTPINTIMNTARTDKDLLDSLTRETLEVAKRIRELRDVARMLYFPPSTLEGEDSYKNTKILNMLTDADFALRRIQYIA